MKKVITEGKYLNVSLESELLENVFAAVNRAGI